MRLPETRFAALSPAARLGLLVAAAILGVLLLWTALQPPLPLHDSQGPGDRATYAAIVERLKAGESYYPAAHAELLANNYGTLSVFNWRTPLWPTLLAAIPGSLMLGALAVLALGLAFTLLRRLGDTGFAVIGAAALSLNLVVVLAGSAVYFAEVPAGLLILVSILGYGLGWRWLGIAAALAGLFTRELAAPYVLICVAFALRDRHWRELLALGVGVIAYTGFFAWHAAMVTAQLGPLDRAYADGWLTFGGLDFMLGAAAFNGTFALLPGWVSALLIPFALLGLAAWRDGSRAALTVGLYLAAFLVVGKPFNTYWGAMVTPAMMLGVPWAIVALAEIRLRRSS
jgi:hypothetical protein